MKKDLEEQIERERRRQTDRHDHYYERQTWFHNGFINHVCLDCRKSAKVKYDRENKKCPHCNSENFHLIGFFVRVPKKKASNAKWKKFEKLFYLDR
jgi:hypothetical protein